jgi:flagellar motor protein MotB
MIFSEVIVAKKPVDSNPNKWLLSFADLLSLILTFFVLIYSMAEPMQFTNEHREDYNSSIAFQRGLDASQIESAQQKNVLDNTYLLGVISDKTANDDGMKGFVASIDEEELKISISRDRLNVDSAKSLFQTIDGIGGQMRFVSADLATSRDVANQFQKLGMQNPITYFEDKSLQNNIEIIIYPEF